MLATMLNYAPASSKCQAVEQAIGQILLLIQERDERLQELEGRVHSVRQALDGEGEQSVIPPL